MVNHSLARNIPKWSINVQNGSKVIKMVGNSPKWFKMINNGQKLCNMIKYSPKWSKMVRDHKKCLKLFKIVQNHPKLFICVKKMYEMVQNCLKGSKLVKNGTNWSRAWPSTSNIGRVVFLTCIEKGWLPLLWPYDARRGSETLATLCLPTKDQVAPPLP